MLLHILTDKIRKQYHTSQHGYHKNCIKPEKEMKTIIWFNCIKLCIHTYMHMLKIYMRIKNNKIKVLLSTKEERLMCGKVGGRDHKRGFYFLCEYLLFIKILMPDYRFQIPKSFLYFFFTFVFENFLSFWKQNCDSGEITFSASSSLLDVWSRMSCLAPCLFPQL